MLLNSMMYSLLHLSMFYFILFVFVQTINYQHLTFSVAVCLSLEIIFTHVECPAQKNSTSVSFFT